MIKKGWLICSIVFLAFSTHLVYSQDGRTTLTSLSVTEVYAERDYEAGSLDNEYRWKIWFETDPEVCIQLTREDPGWFDYNHELTTNFHIPNLPASTLTLRMEGWEEDGCGGECTYNTGITCVDDEGHCAANDQFLSIGNFAPGVTNSTVLWACTSGNPYAVRYDFSYRVPQPQTPTVIAQAGQICDLLPPIQLTSSSFINSSFLSSTRFVWEYWSTASPGWRSLSQTTANVNSGRYSFSGIRFLTGIFGMTTNTDVFFRVKTRYTAPNGAIHESTFSNTSIAVHLSPLPPSISSVSTTPSCPAQSTGTITVNVTGMGEYLYILRAGENTGPCNPELGNCGGSKSGRVFTNTFDITGIARGKYTLLVANRGGNEGVCWSSTYLDVDEIPVLQLQSPDITHVTCHSGADGAVNLISTGGIAPWQYTLTRASFSSVNATGEFSALVTGNYTSSVTDGCGQLATSPININEPLNILATVSPISPSCNLPANGSVQVDVTQGEGTYSFNLKKDDQQVEELNGAEINTWTVPGLSDGTYIIEIKDAERLQCDGFAQPVSLATPKTLEVIPNNIITKDLTCFERNDGSIQLNNADVTGDIQYVLTRQTLGAPITLTTASLFENLPAGDYDLVIRRNLSGCDEEFRFPTPIEIRQPARQSIALDKRNISCYGRTDGKIITAITGATPTDSYQWEIKLDGNWATLNATNSILENLSEGIYRMKLTNANNCNAESEEASVIEPDKLSIISVATKDVACLGEKGEIEVILNGGVTPYSYDFSTGTSIEHSASQRTNLAEGTYTLVAVDVNGCSDSHTEPLRITAPAVKLSFTHTLSDFNGYHISCAGAANGIADVVATGGNEPGYAGYKYALDNIIPQDNARLKNIPAGLHTISVLDGRGCSVSKSVTFTEPASQLEPLLVLKKDVKCFGDKDGKLSIDVTGGVSPYSFKLNQVLTQQSGSFTGLAPGNYTISISDKNDCTTEYQDRILILTTPMEIALLKKDVRCFDGADGAVEAEVTGGARPLQYTWKDIPDTNSGVTNLKAGQYTLSVSDQQGCAQEKSIIIFQPEALSLKITPIPVCVGKANGEIWLDASGGIEPYEYSVDQGVIFQDEPKFKAIAAGSYEVRVKDGNSCQLLAFTNVIVRNDTPQPNFIVASKQSALDTLVVKEISVPKPDSVEWLFDPAITVVKQDTWSPEIMVHEPGNYTVGMKGYFGGCDYTNTLTISINPFDSLEKINTNIPFKIIKSMTVTPNPNTGEFDVSIELHAKQRLSLRVMDVLGVVHYQENWDKTLGVEKRINISESVSTSGVYVVRAVTDTDSQELRIVINR